LGKFLLKTKNTKLVENAGLIPNSVGYEMINLVETTNASQNPGAIQPQPTASGLRRQ
jgi:hypothetical protein